MVGASGFEPPTSWSRKMQSKNPSASFGVAWEPEGHSFSPSVVPKLYGNWWPHCARARPQSVLIDKFGQVSGARRLERQFTAALFAALLLRLPRTCGLGDRGILRLQIPLDKSDRNVQPTQLSASSRKLPIPVLFNFAPKNPSSQPHTGVAQIRANA